MTINRLASLLCCALLSSCATEYPVSTNSTDPTVQFALQKRDLFEIYAGSPGCSAPAHIPDQHNPSKAGALPLPIPAGKEFMFTITARLEYLSGTGMTSQTNTKSCSSTAAFMPQSGVRYRARLERDGYRCHPVVVSVHQVGNREVEVPERTMRPIFSDRPGVEASSTRPLTATVGGGSSARSVSCPAQK